MDKHKRLINLVYSNSKYLGKHIVIIGGKIYSAENGKSASKLLGKLIKQHPDEIPTITYIPKADALILFLF